MALVTPPVVYPRALAGQSNGELSPAILVLTPGLSGGPTVRLVPTATRCWRAMAAAALQDGIALRATGYNDSYRSLRAQVSLFTSRYQTDPTGNGYKLWDSDGNGTRERWYKMDGVATAAVPGTSNHGWAIAVDIANATGSRLAWLEQHAPGFGWGWELVPEEPWHVRNFTGDQIPAAVLAYEQEQDMDKYQAAALDNVNRMLFGLTGMADTVDLHPGNNPDVPLVTVPNAAVATLKKIAAEVGMDPAELAAIAKAAHDGAAAGAPSAQDIAEAVLDEAHNRTAE